MSAGCLRCAASDLAETVSLAYGFVLEDVRWQIDFLAAVPARAVVSAVPASASTAIENASRFMFLPPKSNEGHPFYVSKALSGFARHSSETRWSLIGGSEVRGRSCLSDGRFLVLGGASAAPPRRSPPAAGRRCRNRRSQVASIHADAHPDRRGRDAGQARPRAGLERRRLRCLRRGARRSRGGPARIGAPAGARGARRRDAATRRRRGRP